MKMEKKIDEERLNSISALSDGVQNNVHPLWKKVSIGLVISLVLTIGYMISTDQSENEIPENLVRYHIAQFVENIRNISSDPIVIRKNLEKAYAYTTRKGRKQLDRILKSVNLNEKLTQKTTVSIQITSIKQKHETLYTVFWTETEYQNSTQILKTNHEGYFRLVFSSSKKIENTYSINPSDIYINNIVIKKTLPKTNLES